MSDAADRSSTKVLHIVTGSAQMAAEVEAGLRAAGLAVERCGDVYRGLARLKPDSAGLPEVLVVGVDGLGPAQLEFFEHAARLLPSVPVFVYGSAHHEQKLDKALQLGATARLTEDVLQELAQPAPAEADADLTAPVPTAQAQVPAVADQLVGGVLEETPAAPEATAAPPADESDVMDKPEAPDEPGVSDEIEELTEIEEDIPEEPDPVLAEESPAPASRPRVPWIRDADRPVRRPPSSRAAPAHPEQKPAGEPETLPEPAPASSGHEYSEVPPEPEEKSEDGKYAPLLSAEEWQALMGDDDDVSAIAPPDPEQEGVGP